MEMTTSPHRAPNDIRTQGGQGHPPLREPQQRLAQTASSSSRGGRLPGALGGDGSEASRSPADDKTRAPGASTTGASCDAPRAQATWVLYHVEMNTLSAADGVIHVWMGRSEGTTLYNVTLRVDEYVTIQGVQFRTFFGDSTSDWASPNDQEAWFADVSGAIVQS
ncbi:hypothetical protein M0805_002878 [Coniferiporia weirii]|nr:hypothetical protein M0805_002878 [Coniferiporia weirii]